MTEQTSAPMSAATSNKSIDKLIGKVKTSGEEFNKNVQAAIEAIISHAMAYGDATKAANLVGVMPTTTRRAEVIKHFADYSLIRVVTDSKLSTNKIRVFKASLFKEDDKVITDRIILKKNTPWDLEGCKANPWYDRQGMERPQEFDLLFSSAEDRAWSLVTQLENMATAKVTIKDNQGNEIKVNKIAEHDQHRVKFLAAAIKSAIKSAKNANLDGKSEDENTEENTNQPEGPVSNAA